VAAYGDEHEKHRTSRPSSKWLLFLLPVSIFWKMRAQVQKDRQGQWLLTKQANQVLNHVVSLRIQLRGLPRLEYRVNQVQIDCSQSTNLLFLGEGKTVPPPGGGKKLKQNVSQEKQLTLPDASGVASGCRPLYSYGHCCRPPCGGQQKTEWAASDWSQPGRESLSAGPMWSRQEDLPAGTGDAAWSHWATRAWHSSRNGESETY
jgi:hypothetical protein